MKPSLPFRFPLSIIAGMLLGAVTSTVALAVELEAFTEPYYQIAVPASETGVISELRVAEGDVVDQGQVVAQLDDEVLQASLRVAHAAKEATGAMQSAQEELIVLKKQLESYRKLHAQGHATQRELDRSETQSHQAASRLQSIREERDVRRLEYERVKVQIKQRMMRSPVSGVVVAIEKEVGEFVSVTDPVVMHVVQLETLKTVFSVPYVTARSITAGQRVSLNMDDQEVLCQGVVEFVSPIVNAESGTALIKIRIPNEHRKIPSGVVCRWDLKVESPVPRIAERGTSETN